MFFFSRRIGGRGCIFPEPQARFDRPRPFGRGAERRDAGRPPGARPSLARLPFLFLGGHGGEATPVPIPNTEVKGPSGEGTAAIGRGRVARRQGFSSRPPGSETIRTAFFSPWDREGREDREDREDRGIGRTGAGTN